ncbi:MAG: YjgP/YjgQ family permease [Candidatus Omnitrophica bacterium]|nr:YjgP/YjgQ family permease [Candidatus Omnitrophota bacterium]
MRILDRYILKSIVSIFICCIFIFLFLYIVIDILSHLEDILKHHTPLALLVRYYLWNLPIMFVQVSPFACLLSTLYSFGKLNHDNEIIAMRSSGLSIYDIAKTVIVFACVISLFAFWINDRFVPQSISVTQKLKGQIEDGAKKEKSAEAIYSLTLYGLKNRLFFVNKFIPDQNVMENIVILEQDEHQNVLKKIVANRGIYENSLWKFYQCLTYNFDKNGQVIQEPQYYDEEIMAIPETPQDFINQRQRPELMRIAELDEYIWKLSRSGASSIIRNAKLELYQRFTMPLTSFVIVLLGIPFSLILRKRATGLASVGLCIVVGVLYYLLTAVCVALGRSVLPALVAASLSHAVALSYSLRLIRSLP